MNFRSPNTNLMLSDALEMLQRLPELRRCSLNIGRSSIFTSPGTPMVVPKLQKLFIYAESDQLDFFRAVVLPQARASDNTGTGRHCNRSLFERTIPSNSYRFAICQMGTSLTAFNLSFTHKPPMYLPSRSNGATCAHSIHPRR